MKQIQLPERLFRYRSADTDYFETELENAVLRNRIFLAQGNELNDPFDFRPKYIVSSLKEINAKIRAGAGVNVTRATFSNYAGGRMSRSLYRSKTAEIRKPLGHARLELFSVNSFVRNLPSRTRLACFSELADSVPMWGHYADNHRGVCLEYEVKLGSGGQRRGLRPFPVTYQSERPTITTVELMDIASKSNRRPSEDDLFKVLDTIYLRKGLHWSYEKEWRVFDVEQNPPGYYTVDCLKPVRLRIGFRASDEFFNKILGLYSSKIEVVRVKPSEERFGIVER